MRKFLLCTGLFLSALTANGRAHAQFAPTHTGTYLDSRRNAEIRHRTLARMLMTLGMDPDEVATSSTDTSNDVLPQMPVRRFEEDDSLSRVPRRRKNHAPDEWRPTPYHSKARGELAVVQVNREIGLSATGSWTNYKEKPLWEGPETGYDRETGWAPGFQFDASTMFDLYEVQHILLAGHVAFSDGNVGYHGSASNGWQTLPYRNSSNRETIDARIELGKGLMVTDRFMITPAIMGGYWSWGRNVKGSQGVSSSSEDYAGFVAGIVVHLDYAVTDAFVVRGRLCWDERLGSHMDAAGVKGTFRLRPRPEWIAALDFDYRLSRSLHFISGVQYSYYSFGRSQSVAQHGGYSLYEPSSWTNGMTLHAGIAYAF
ncbi:hypothetical protein GOB87_09370 [Acetobacter estunensis]|uniref:Uncharacterized protein n=1 Tax=Acetobacter estunensis TaxID=104097 RepID=A0A967B8L5_9PROT|nr:hypothetical protein [Acetobacter estunensis]NHO54161.1 hypothetical protein [Acetobacter estunensis]